MVLVPGCVRKKLDAATLEVLAKQERKDPVVYFLKSSRPIADARLTVSETADVYVGRSTIEELFLMLNDERVEHVNIGKKYLPVYK